MSFYFFSAYMFLFACDFIYIIFNIFDGTPFEHPYTTRAFFLGVASVVCGLLAVATKAVN